jgi:hypothetical protein
MSSYRIFALKAPDSSWGFRVHYVQNGQDTLIARNVAQLKSESQALALGNSILLLLTNGNPGTILGNPVEKLKLHQVSIQVHVTTEETHRLEVSAFTPDGDLITAFTANGLRRSADEVESVADLLPRGLDLIAKALGEFGMAVPPDYAFTISIVGTDEEFAAKLRRAVGNG